MRRAAPFAALLLAGCATISAEQARDPFGSHSLVGANIADVIGCAGTDFTFVQTDVGEGVVQYATTNQDKGFDLDVEGVSLQVGGAGSCKLALTVLGDGTVARVTFPQSHVDGLSLPYQACGSMVGECLRDPAVTTRVYPYDAMKWLNEKQHAAESQTKVTVTP